MKLFVATQETQGQRNNDFCHAREGEILIFSVITCDGEETDGACGCKRCLCGIEIGATTTMRVAEISQINNINTLSRIIYRSLRNGGWPKAASTGLSKEFAQRLRREAKKFSVGDIVEYRDDKFAKRQK